MTKAGLVASIEALRKQSMMRKGCMSVVGDACNMSDCWMDHPKKDVTPISPEESISLNALISYVAHTTNNSTFKIERSLADAFCVPNIKFLPADQYNNAVHHLVEQIPPRAVNM